MMKANDGRLARRLTPWTRNWQLYLLLLPAIAYLIVFKYVPMYGVQIAFRKYTAVNGIAGSQWVGLKHFEAFFNSYQFNRVLINTIVLSVYELLLGFPLPIILALMLNQIRSARSKAVLENIFYIPHFISIVVLVGMVNVFFGYSSGFVNNVAAMLGGERVDYIGKAAAFRHLYVFSGIWKNAGWNAIIYLAALSGIDPGLYEAATIDGASRIRKMISIELPGILPVIVMMFVMGMGNIMSVGFEKAYLMQNALNSSTSEIIATYVYKVGLLQVKYDYSAAVGLFNNVINIVLLVSANTISRRLTENSLW
jgi:ABC-type polysaccharide transport system, permease component